MGAIQSGVTEAVSKMTYRLEIRPTATADIFEAASWYDKKQAGVGSDFSHTVLAAIESMVETPLIHAIRNKRKGSRSFIAPRFPYKIHYRIEDEVVVVFAVIHAARRDREWMKRI
jgi:toxin ParE1/3/4